MLGFFYLIDVIITIKSFTDVGVNYMIKKPWRMERYVMLALIIFAYVIEIIQRMIIDTYVSGTNVFQPAIFLRGSIFLMLVFLHPKYKSITGVVYSLYWGATLIQNILSMSTLPFGSLDITQWIGFIMHMMVIVVAIIAGFFIFFKKDLFHPFYLIFPIVLLVMNLPQLFMSLPSWIFFSQHISHSFGFTFLIAQLIGFVITLIFFVVLLLFGISLYHMSREKKESPSPSNAQQIYDMLHELDTLYGDGVFSKEEYEAKKQKLLKERA